MLFGNININANDRFPNNQTAIKNIDSVHLWIDSSRNKNLKLQIREFYLHKAYKESLKERNDSLRNSYLSRVSFTFLSYLKDSLMFREVNKKALNLSFIL